MSFDFSQITYDDAIKIGSDDAPLKIVEYINLRCPDSKKYEEEVIPYLNHYIEEGKIQRILKHFDKEVHVLEKGNLLNQYLDYRNSSATYEIIQDLFKEQRQWGQKRIAEIPHFAQTKGLKLQSDNLIHSINVMKEIEEIGIEYIPTIFVGDNAFVETISFDNFKDTVDKYFK